MPSEILHCTPPEDLCRAPEKVASWHALPVVPRNPVPTLQALFEELHAAFEAEASQGIIIDNSQPAASFARLNARVQALLTRYTKEGSSDWRRYAAFNSHHYIRHLIEESPHFEILLVCWQPGQGSHIHDHDNSHCWLTCLDGTLEEKHYQAGESASPVAGSAFPASALPGVERVTSPCPAMHATHSQRLGPGDTGYISDRIALHTVACPSGTPAPGAVSLHVYAPPIRRVRLFTPQEDQVVVRKPGFWSVRGVRT
uniref:Cysteine dioxygenase n=1 Tax=Auxenochlorella protothecoides TaxID=3075 RepID=A0A1D2AHT4_AUXPR